MFLITDPIFHEVQRGLSPAILVDDLHSPPAEDSKQVKGIITRLGKNLDAKTLERFPNLQFVATVTTGLDHIDLGHCADNDIEVISLKNETDFLSTIQATPEHTWALLLALLRNLPSAFQSVKEGKWDRTLFFGSELNGKTLGIIGLGRIGKIISRYAKAFDMKILAYDKETIELEGVEPCSLETLYNESHIITVHLPLENETVDFIDDQAFEKMSQKPLIINTARGKIINEKALVKALEVGQVSGAATDVLSNETSFKDKKVESSLRDYALKNDNLIITPHIAGSTYESMERTAQFIEEKVLSFIKEKQL